ncbi:hypothetical protein B7P34_05465 [Streptosporangium nondiastaticum]|uniref:Uncharacterized protein n=1 Tax=Streptosporangium nondiastaticum TaxID=35764 RepID=A0A9X7PIZ5_9ACTN|nr:hypothetical protein B7P34_05465 [Streptosporangium nondiastaticum]
MRSAFPGRPSFLLAVAVIGVLVPFRAAAEEHAFVARMGETAPGRGPVLPHGRRGRTGRCRAARLRAAVGAGSVRPRPVRRRRTTTGG